GEMQALAECCELLGFEDGPVLPAEAFDHVVVEPAEVVAIERLFAGLGDDADFLDAGLDGFLADDLNHRLGQPVAIDERKHLLGDRGGRGILARPTPGSGNHGFSYFWHKRWPRYRLGDLCKLKNAPFCTLTVAQLSLLWRDCDRGCFDFSMKRAE